MLNSNCIIRSKQFEANHPGVVISTDVPAVGTKPVKGNDGSGNKTMKKKEQGMTLAQAKNDHKSIPPIPTTDNDKLTYDDVFFKL